MASSNLDRLLLEILSNEPSRTSILEEDYEAESGCGVLLGAALRRNTFVSEIDLRVYALVSTMTHDLIWDDDDPDTETTRYNYASIDLRLLLDYLRGPIVQKIKLTPGLSQDQNVPLDNNAVLGVLLPAIAENPNPSFDLGAVCARCSHVVGALSSQH
jgi:hypothetical protein